MNLALRHTYSGLCHFSSEQVIIEPISFVVHWLLLFLLPNKCLRLSRSQSNIRKDFIKLLNEIAVLAICNLLER